MWLSLAFLSAALLGLYDVAKKYSLRENAVIPVLFCNTLFCALIFLPLHRSLAYRHPWQRIAAVCRQLAMARTAVYRSEILYCTVVVDIGLLCHQTSSDHYRRSGQRHPSRADSARRAYYLRRAS